jgi:hypothetical protein
MHDRKRPILTLRVIACATLLATAGAAAAQTRAPAVTPYDGDRELFDIGLPDDGWFNRDGVGPGVQAAADHVIGQQCIDGGWGWPHASCTTTYNNITAPICLGLLRAYDATGDADTLAAAIDGGDFDVAAVFPNATPAFGSFAPGFLHILSGAAYANDASYSNHAATGFFDRLTAGTYGDPAVDATYYPADTYDYIARHNALRSGYTINLRPWDMHYMPWVAGLIGNADSTTPADAVSQQTAFLDHLMAGINTLDDTDAVNVPWDLIGLAGGVRGLALNGTTVFAALTAPDFTAIQGTGRPTSPRPSRPTRTRRTLHMPCWRSSLPRTRAADRMTQRSPRVARGWTPCRTSTAASSATPAGPTTSRPSPRHSTRSRSRRCL